MRPERGIDRRSNDIPAAEQQEHRQPDRALPLAVEQLPAEREEKREPQRIRKQQRQIGSRAEHRRQQVGAERRAQEQRLSTDIIGERPGIGREVAEHGIADLPIGVGVEEPPLPAEREQREGNGEDDSEAPQGNARKIVRNPLAQHPDGRRRDEDQPRSRGKARPQKCSSRRLSAANRPSSAAARALTDRPARTAARGTAIAAAASLTPRRRSFSEGRGRGWPARPRPCSAARAPRPAAACGPGCGSRSRTRRECR